MKQFAQQFFFMNINLTLRKNADYSGDKGIWSTFTIVEKYGIKTTDGFVTRMSDKVQRIDSLLDRDAQVKDESIKDTLADLANYCMLMTGFLLEQKSLDIWAHKFYNEVMETVAIRGEADILTDITGEAITAIRIHLAKTQIDLNLGDTRTAKSSLIKIAYYSCLIAYEQNNRINRTQSKRNKMEEPGYFLGETNSTT